LHKNRKAKLLAMKYGTLVLAGDSIMFFAVLIATIAPFFNFDGPRIYFPSRKSGGSTVFFFRILHNAISWYEYGRLIACSGIILTIFVSVSDVLLNMLTDKGTPVVLKFKIHNWLSIFECVLHDILKVIAPFLILASICLAVSSNYVLARLYNVQIVIYVFFILLSFCHMITIYVFLPPAVRFDEVSHAFLKSEKEKLVNGRKLERKYLMSIRPLRLHVASLGYLSKKAKKEFFEVMFTQTMNVLLIK